MTQLTITLYSENESNHGYSRVTCSRSCSTV